LIALGVIGVNISAQESDLVSSIQADIRKTQTVYQEVEARALRYFELGNEGFFKRQYKDAVDNYLEAITVYKSLGEGENNEVFRKRISDCREQIAKSYFNWAEDMVLAAEKEAATQDFNEAIKLLNEAALIYPDHKKKIDARIERYEKLRQAAERELEVQESRLLKDKEEREYNIQLLLKQARLLALKNRLVEARSKYDEILILNPFQLEAVQGKHAVNARITKAGEDRFNQTGNMEYAVQAMWKWALPIKAFEIDVDKSIWSEQVPKDLPDNKIQQKLRSIIIPRIDFEDVTIPTAIKYIREQSKVHDPDGEGVNIFLRLALLDENASKDGARPAAAPKTVDTTMVPNLGNGLNTESESYDGPAATSETTLNFALTNKTLQEAIYFLCRAANLKMRVEKYAVVVASHNIPLDDLETRVFPLEQAALASVGGGSDPEELKRYFTIRGVRFPEGARVLFDPKLSRLIATNTLENLHKIEEAVLKELDQVDPLVQIQAKFVEIEQTDLKELGFNYTLSRTIADGQSSNGKLEFGPNDTTLLRSLSVSEYSGMDQVFSFSRSVNGFQFDMMVNAVDQADNKDILASPRITTMNNQPATIKMVRIVFLPEEYSDPTEETHNASNDSSTSFTVFMAGSPDFEEQSLGVTWTVQPQVDLAAQTINITGGPLIRDHIGWTSYTYKADADDTLSTVMKRAIISERQIDTNITIKDGETIVLGGIIKDSFSSIDDKIPFLGDIPVLGRFFQSRYTQNVKTNLLIFLHCRLIKPDGSPFFPENTVSRGLPTFRAEQ
jgi:tetratricopeptide (TPR) repeat protein